jgi:hypothetical protein
VFGICNLNIIPVRKEKTSKSELVSQLLYGDLFTILKEEDNWYYIEILDDNYNGWINYSQLKKISENDFKKLQKTKTKFLHDISTEIETSSGKMIISIGSKISYCNFLNHKLIKDFKNEVYSIEETARKYLNTPYLWGGKTSSGIDCSGFTQMVFKLNNIELKRDAYQQAKQGKEITLNCAKEGDLVFFGEKKITHVGIMINKDEIIHAFGKIRIDKINKKGILNIDSNKITHKLKKVVTLCY